MSGALERGKIMQTRMSHRNVAHQTGVKCLSRTFVSGDEDSVWSLANALRLLNIVTSVNNMFAYHSPSANLAMQ